MSYYIDVRHEGLHKYRRITGCDPRPVEQKAAEQMAAWNESWARTVATRSTALAKEAKREAAAEQTRAAQAELDALDHLLLGSLAQSLHCDWEALKRTDTFPTPTPTEPTPTLLPREPLEDDRAFAPQIGFLDWLVPGRRARRRDEAHQRFTEAGDTGPAGSATLSGRAGGRGGGVWLSAEAEPVATPGEFAPGA